MDSLIRVGCWPAALVLAIALILGQAPGSMSFKKGAPGGACEALTPVHGTATGQESVPPYTVSVTPGRQPGRWAVTLMATRGLPFRGLILQARTHPDLLSTPGQFVSIPPTLRMASCSDNENSYVTHVDPEPKMIVTADWESPYEFEGDVFFLATAVHNFTTFWTKIKSNPISVTKREAGPESGPPKLSFENDAYSGCGVSKKCLGSTLTCIKERNCSTFVSVMPVGGNYEFEMFAKDSQYVAVGLSEDNIMGGDGDSVVECINGNSTVTPVKVYRSYNSPNRKENIRLDESEQRKLRLLASKIENNAIYCKVSHDSVVEIRDRVFDLDRKEYYMLLASGPKLKENGVGIHSTSVVSSHKAKLEDLTPPFIKNELYEGCGTIKNCFGTPDGCVDSHNCKAAVAVFVRGSTYEFELIGKSTGYVAVGLSTDGKMGDDSVVECVNGVAESNYKTVKLYMSYNVENGKANSREGVNQDGVNLLNSSFIDGTLYCKFARNERTTVNGKVFDLKNNEYFLLLAKGSGVRASGVGYHDTTSAAAQKRLLSDVSAFSEASKLLLRLHGAFMIIAWLGCASTGIILARYFKMTWVGKSHCGKDLWFAWHRFLMLLTWCLTIAAFVIIFVEIGEWVEGGSQLHAILGCVTTFFAFIQPIGAAFRPAPNAHNRPIFNWFHWFFGNMAYIFGMATIFLALPLSKAELPSWFNFMLVPHVALYAVSHLLLSFDQCCTSKESAKITSMSMKDLHSNSSPPIIERKMDAPHAGFRKAILGLFITAKLIIVIAIVLIVVLAPIEEKWKAMWPSNEGMA